MIEPILLRSNIFLDSSLVEFLENIFFNLNQFEDFSREKLYSTKKKWNQSLLEKDNRRYAGPRFFAGTRRTARDCPHRPSSSSLEFWRPLKEKIGHFQMAFLSCENIDGAKSILRRCKSKSSIKVTKVIEKSLIFRSVDNQVIQS